MNKKAYIVLLFVFMFSLAGCGVKNADNKKGSEDITMGDSITESNDNSLTMEYVCEEFNIDESEFEGVDFDAFVSYYGLTYDNIKEGNPRFLLNNYKSKADKTKVPDYKSIKVTTSGFLPEYKDKVEIVIIENVQGEACFTTIIDFSIGKVFSATGSVGNISAKNIVKDVDDTVKKAVADAIDKYDICSWKADNKSNDSDLVGTSSGCTIIIKMTDDNVYGISCKMGQGDNTKNIDEFVSDIEKLSEK